MTMADSVRKQQANTTVPYIVAAKRAGTCKVVAAIPCWNTEAYVAAVVRGAMGYVDEVVVIDDGSMDDTARVAAEAGAIVVRHGVNKGYGEAIKSCFIAARERGADVLVTIDGDGQHDPAEIQRVLGPIESGKAELVIGSRFIDGAGPTGRTESTVPKYRGFGIRVITLLFNLGSRTKVSDSQSGFRAYDKRMLDLMSLTETGMAVSIEILEEARRGRAAIAEVPITCAYESHRMTMKAIKHGLTVAFSVLCIRATFTLKGLFGKRSRAS